ncbi:MAG: YggT family protein [Gammaproteobacteria bacterium]|nr:YggT family protein [Gammaproteobacteria bacterium]
MLSVGQEIALFLFGTIFSIYISLVMIRFLLAIVRADFYNPISQTIVRFTNPPLVLLRRIIPPVGRIDTSAIVLMLILQLLELWLRTFIIGHPVPVTALFVLAIFELIKLTIWVYIIALILQAIMSWINPGMYQMQNPMASILHQLTAPIMKPIRNMLPRTGMIDFSPMLAIIGLYVLLIIVNGILRSLIGG